MNEAIKDNINDFVVTEFSMLDYTNQR